MMSENVAEKPRQEIPFSYGGQAVIEGVLMRGARNSAIAVRDPDGRIIVHEQPLNRTIYQSRIGKIPFVRGIVGLWDALGLGLHALMWSADIAVGEEEDAFAPAPVVLDAAQDFDAQVLKAFFGGFADFAEEEGLEAGPALAVVEGDLGEHGVGLGPTPRAAKADLGGAVGEVTLAAGGVEEDLLGLGGVAGSAKVDDLVGRAAGQAGGLVVFGLVVSHRSCHILA